MPLYDFTCSACGASFELSLTLAEQEGESAKKICPSCASKDIQQKMTFSGGIIGGGLKTISDDGPPCASGGPCAGGSCPWKG